MTSPLEEITARIAAGESPAAILRALRPAGWEPLLKACAAAGTFDRVLFDSVLLPFGGPDAPTLDRLAELEVIDPVPGAPGEYWLPHDDLTAYLKSWLGGSSGGAAPEDLAELEKRLADHRAATGDRREQLRHLLVADLPQGLRLFEDLFAEADRKRDFARCQDLLDVLADPDRLTVFGPDVAGVREDRVGYLRVRSLWAVDYARCAQYLAQCGLEEQTDALMAGSETRVWEVFGSAGMGKTMRLRWLVTRYCVSAERDIPCARIDFDVVSPVAMGRYPWLALLEAAAQFDNRWPKRTFGKLDEHASYRSLLNRRPDALNRAAAGGLRTRDLDVLQSEITEDFIGRFNEAAGDRPALLVCDTLEELLLRGTQGMSRFLELLGDVQKGCPGLRIVLAGRYDLAERVPEALAALEGRERIEVTAFTDEQTETYLRQIRGIGDAGKRAVARQRSNGRPLTLVLFADAIELEPELTAEALEKTPEPTMPLLIDRVVRRITEPEVRWLLRYGVVPRKLRREDLTVMRPFFLRNMPGPTPSDDPDRDVHGLGSTDAYPFAPPPADEAALDRIWQQLLNYAGSSSWVSQAAEDPSTVVFHPDVLVPQRLLIADHEVYADLHRAFARHYAALADQFPSQWTDFTRKAVYHRFQLGDPEAAAVWRSALRRAREADELDELHELAAEVLGRDYLDENGRPRSTRDGVPLISYAEVAEAHLQEAYVLSCRALREQADAGDPQWGEVEDALSQVRRARAAAPEAIPESGRERAVRATVLNANGRAEEALQLAESALAAVGSDELPDVLRVLGDSKAAVGDPTAHDAYQQAFKLAVGEGRTAQAEEIGLALVRERETNGRLDEALSWCERLGEHGPPSPIVILTHARLLLACYRPGACLLVLQAVVGGKLLAGSATVGDLVEAELLRAQAAFMLGWGDRSLAALNRAVESTEGIPGVARYRLQARIHQLSAVVLGELLAVDDADRYFRQAESLWEEFGYRGGHPECRYLHARFLLRDVGDLAETRELLSATGRRTGSPPGRSATPEDEFALRTELLGRELVIEEGGRPEPGDLTMVPRTSMPPRRAALLAAHRLVEAWWRNRESVPALLEHSRASNRRPPGCSSWTSYGGAGPHTAPPRR
ncbi:hypothetical protein ACIGXI_35650 [Kitasatospora aureofaciens]|uniref:hypothetical protein n=1 Tax=Kitasatospora aureofaciens TaxID=1894 RepID=UPI0037C964EB